MEYGWEALAILLAAILPLGCVIWFLRNLIGGLGNSSTVTPSRDEEA